MLDALMDGRALTAKALACCGGVSPQTASSRLAEPAEAGLTQPEKYGRNRYHRLASAQVAGALAAMLVLAGNRRPRRQPGPQALEDMRIVRTCYDHLAGSLGVALTRSMVEREILSLQDGECAPELQHWKLVRWPPVKQVPVVFRRQAAMAVRLR